MLFRSGRASGYRRLLRPPTDASLLYLNHTIKFPVFQHELSIFYSKNALLLPEKRQGVFCSRNRGQYQRIGRAEKAKKMSFSANRYGSASAGPQELEPIPDTL